VFLDPLAETPSWGGRPTPNMLILVAPASLLGSSGCSMGTRVSQHPLPPPRGRARVGGRVRHARCQRVTSTRPTQPKRRYGLRSESLQSPPPSSSPLEGGGTQLPSSPEGILSSLVPTLMPEEPSFIRLPFRNQHKASPLPRCGVGVAVTLTLRGEGGGHGRSPWHEAHPARLSSEGWQLNPLGVHSPRLAASSSYRRKPVSMGPDWIPPHQVRGRCVKHGMTGQDRRRFPAACCGKAHSRPSTRLLIIIHS